MFFLNSLHILLFLYIVLGCLCGLKDTHLFLIILEAGNAKIKMLADLVSGEDLHHGSQRSVFFLNIYLSIYLLIYLAASGLICDMWDQVSFHSNPKEEQ